MASIVHARGVPTTFQKLDDSVTAADRYLSVYERKKILENFNFLMARRIPRTLVCGASVNHETSQTPAPVSAIGDFTDFPFNRVWASNIRVAPWTNVLNIRAYFHCSDGATTVKMKATYVPLNGKMIDDTSTMTDAVGLVAKSSTEHSMDIVIEPTESGQGMLFLQAQGDTVTPAVATGQIISDSGPDFVDVAYNASNINVQIDFSDASIGRVVRSAKTSKTGGVYRYHIRDRFRPYPPTPGSVTANFYTPVTVDIASVCVLEQGHLVAIY